MCFELVEAVAKPGCKRVHSSSCHGSVRLMSAWWKKEFVVIRN